MSSGALENLDLERLFRSACRAGHKECGGAMSITLLEFVVAGILLVVAWQLGIAIAPWIMQKIRGLKHDLDEVAEEIIPDQPEEVSSNHNKESGSNHNYRNN
jgi:hypothetical protein